MKYALAFSGLLIINLSYAQWSVPKSKIYKDAESEKEVKLSKRQYKKTFRYQFYKHHEDLVDEFYQRLKRNKREYRKLQRKMKKPQYSDPSYFGHKRKPKIRAVGKRKLCKECGIVH